MATFEIVEVAVVGIALVEFPIEFASWLQPFYFVLGALIAALGGWLWLARDITATAVTSYASS